MTTTLQPTQGTNVTRSRWLASENIGGASLLTPYETIFVTLNEGKIDDNWRLSRSIMLLVDREDDGWYVVSDDLFRVYGDAANFRAALTEYISALIDHYEFLERELRENSNHAVRREAEFARRYLQRIPV